MLQHTGEQLCAYGLQKRLMHTVGGEQGSPLRPPTYVSTCSYTVKVFTPAVAQGTHRCLAIAGTTTAS